MDNRKIELHCSVDVEKDVERRIKNVGVRGLRIDVAKEMGVFNRISMMLCVMHASVAAAYRAFGNIEALIDSFGGKKNDIAKACSDFHKSYEKWLKFWSNYYADENSVGSINNETEALYHEIMRWAQVPEVWHLGDDQRLHDDTDVVIKIEDVFDSVLKFYQCTIDKNVNTVDESWCVMKYDTHLQKQYCIETDVDKSSALMIAKRMSADDPSNVYVTSQVIDIEKEETVITPFKTFVNSMEVGKNVEYLKK